MQRLQSMPHQGSGPKVLFFVPTFNDHAEIPRLVEELRTLIPDSRVLVLDDGSKDPVSPSGDLFIRLDDNYGLGVGMHIALDHALAHGYSAMVRLDGDGQHVVGDVPRLLKPIREDAADVVIGERTNHDSGRDSRSLLRNLVKVYFSSTARLLTKSQAPSDVNSGLLALNEKAMAYVSNLTLERYPEPQILISAARAGLRLEAIAVEQRDRSDGTSTLSLFQAVRMVWRFTVFAIEEMTTRRLPK